MKKYIHTASSTGELEFVLSKIDSILIVGDVRTFDPRDCLHSISITSATQSIKDYATMSRDQLLALPDKEREAIRNINVLRKLKKDELSPMQQMLVYQANAACKDKSTATKVKDVLQKLKDCDHFYIWPTPKNKAFAEEIMNLGGRVRAEDAEEIIQQLHVKDFSHFTYSYLDVNWNCLLAVFQFNGEHTFKAKKKDGQDVTVSGLDLYIKVDIDTLTGEGYGAMSFHHPEYKMTHPYENYPEDKE